MARLTDFTFPLEGLNYTDLIEIERLCQVNGWGFTYSSIHGHIKDPHQHKAAGIRKLIRLASELRTEAKQLITVGDSRNDQEMFDSSLFPYSVGVANIERHLNQMQYHPKYVTEAPGAAGFCELIAALVKNKRQLS
ncbi:MAG: HAD hydrolase family protein [Candidatus Abawacabacteria bacterium]|nr:HAD hydrolase family protein [Candidatus Abawacabacteria bacterium]